MFWPQTRPTLHDGRGLPAQAGAAPQCTYSKWTGDFMSKTLEATETEAAYGAGPSAIGCEQGVHKSRPRIALLSNPNSTGNLAQLPRIREFCADHPDIFHYEVENVAQIGEAMKTIARVRPKVLAINGGDGTVQAALTEIYNGDHFGDERPPVAVLPSGKTNLIALDLGAKNDPIETLEHLIELARTDLGPHTVARELIALRHGDGEERPVIGMFLGGAGLADTMLYCRHKIYPLGLPNGFAHVLTAGAFLMKVFLGIKANFLPPDPKPLQVSVHENGGKITGRFSLLAVTTLEKLLITNPFDEGHSGTLKLLAIEQRASSMIGAIFAHLGGKLGQSTVRGVHFEKADGLTIESESSNIILDGETFCAEAGRPIHLYPARPLAFVKLAA